MTDDRVDDVLADLSGQLDAALALDLAAEVADRSRREAGLVRLVDRLRGAVGRRLVLDYAGARVMAVLEEVGVDWIVIVESAGRRALVPIARVAGIGAVGAPVAAPGGAAVADRLDLRYRLRRLARDRSPVTVLRAGGNALTGIVARVGADYLEVDARDAELSDRSRGRELILVPLAAVECVRWS